MNSELTIKEKVNFLEDKGLNWLEISDILDISYEEIRHISEEF